MSIKKVVEEDSGLPSRNLDMRQKAWRVAGTNKNKKEGSIRGKRELEEVRDDLRRFNLFERDYHKESIYCPALYTQINLFYTLLNEDVYGHNDYGIKSYIEALHHEAEKDNKAIVSALIDKIITIDLPNVKTLRSDVPKNHKQLVDDALKRIDNDKEVHNYVDLSRYNPRFQTELNNLSEWVDYLRGKIKKVESENKSNHRWVMITLFLLSLGQALIVFNS